MQLVIEVDSYVVEHCKRHVKERYANVIEEAVANGTPLPKGHGRLIDEDRVSLSGIHFETERDHAMMIGRLNSAPTIIEADRSVEDGNNNH